MRKGILSEFLQNNNLILRRSTDNDRMGKFMNWFDYEKNVEINMLL